MTQATQPTPAANRIHWLDNLRTAMIFLVVLLHAGIVYESGGGGALFWIIDDPATNRLADILNLLLDIMVMPTIFFVSGFFASLSLRKKGAWPFLKTRFRRLVVPWVFAVFTLMPLYKFLFLASRNIPQEHWTTYFHFNNGLFSQSWLWFLPVLFLFDVVYLGLSRTGIDLSGIGLKTAVSVSALLGFASLVCMFALDAEGWTKNALINFQNERLLLYFLVFLLGALCFKIGTFSSQWIPKKYALALLCGMGPIVYLYLRLQAQSLYSPGVFTFSELADALLNRSMLLLSMAGLLFLSMIAFRLFGNEQGRLARELSRNSYGVYVIHVIVLGFIAWTLLDMALPSLLKFATLTVFTYAACNLIVYVYRTVIKPKIVLL